MMTTPPGATGRLSVKAAAHEITVTGALPEGETTENVSYFIVDTTNNTVVGHVVLPNAVKRKTEVALSVRVPTANASFAIGTFEESGFKASSFLSVRNPSTNNPPLAAVGRAG